MKKLTMTITIMLVIMAGCVSAKGSDSTEAAAESPKKSSNILQPHADIRGTIMRMKNGNFDVVDLRNSDLEKTEFDTFTPWPDASRLPDGFDPEVVMELGKNPGLGVYDLHKQGITGENIKVAIIDQPLQLNHIEYDGKIKSYREIEIVGVEAQMHGPAVTSILAGDTCGVAPGVDVYYWAEPSWKGDYMQRIKALDEIIQFNKGKALSEQIRIVSVSIGYNDDMPNLDKWQEKLKEAEEAGIYVIHCDSNIMGAKPPLQENRDDPASYEVCYFMEDNRRGFTNSLFAPIDNRAYAHWEGTDNYIFGSRGGLSWAAPYIAGVAALGLQINPDLTPKDIEWLLLKSGTPFHGGKLINPAGFIRMIEAGETWKPGETIHFGDAVEIRFEPIGSFEEVPLNRITAQKTGDEIIFTFYYENENHRDASFFNPPAGSEVMLLLSMDAEYGATDLGVPIEVLEKCEYITMKFSPWGEELYAQLNMDDIRGVIR